MLKPTRIGHAPPDPHHQSPARPSSATTRLAGGGEVEEGGVGLGEGQALQRAVLRPHRQLALACRVLEMSTIFDPACCAPTASWLLPAAPCKHTPARARMGGLWAEILAVCHPTLCRHKGRLLAPPAGSRLPRHPCTDARTRTHTTTGRLSRGAKPRSSAVRPATPRPAGPAISPQPAGPSSRPVLLRRGGTERLAAMGNRRLHAPPQRLGRTAQTREFRGASTCPQRLGRAGPRLLP